MGGRSVKSLKAIAVLVFALAVTMPLPLQAQDPKAAVESRVDIAALMRANGIPGMSVAVIHDYRIAWAQGYGATERGGSIAVTPGTLFLAGSISKPVTAVGALALVDAGELSLNSDVNESLKSWKVPASAFTADQKVTLARILEHTSGIVGGDFFPGYAIGTPVPTLLQILTGEPPAINDAIVVSHVPGAEWSYSGNGYLVVQQLMTDASGQNFPSLMRRLVFAPLGMSQSTFEQPLPPQSAPDAARGTLINGNPLAGGWHVQPEMAAGGLWTTPTDLAKLAIEVALESRGLSHRILTAATARAMLAPQSSSGVINILGTPNDPDRMGYGFFVGARHRFGHIGGNVGYQATMVMLADTGNGAIIMTNSDIGLHAGNSVLNAIAKVYGWDYLAPPPP
jgi:CubicO group peptidase (beta-lactamase class C family)